MKTDRGMNVCVAAALLACCAALSSGCAARRAVPRPVPWDLRPPGEFVGDFMLQQEMTFRRGEMERSFQAVLQVRSDELTLVVLTPFGTRAFVLRQQGDAEPEFTNYIPEIEEAQSFHFDPLIILVDIQRTLLRLIDEPPPETGERSAHLDREDVVERWEDGRLVERRFRQRGRSGRAGAFVVSYGDEGYRFGEEPGRIEIRNERVGYELELRTLSFREL